MKIEFRIWDSHVTSYKTRKRFPEEPIVAFTNSTVFVLEFSFPYHT